MIARSLLGWQRLGRAGSTCDQQAGPHISNEGERKSSEICKIGAPITQAAVKTLRVLASSSTGSLRVHSIAVQLPVSTAEPMMQAHRSVAGSATGASTPAGAQMSSAALGHRKGDRFAEATTPSAHVSSGDMFAESKIPRKRKQSGRDGGTHRDGRARGDRARARGDRDDRDDSNPTETETGQICWAAKSAASSNDGGGGGGDDDDDPHLQSPITDVCLTASEQPPTERQSARAAHTARVCTHAQ